MNNQDNGFSTVLKQTLIVLALSVVTVAIVQPVFCLLSSTGLYEWSLPKFLFGSIYGMLLGVGNFFAMALSLILLTASAAEAKEGKARAQSTYLVRQLVLMGLAVVGCLLPIFHIVSVLGSLAVTQLVIALYALIGNVIALKKNPLPVAKADSTTDSDTIEDSKEEEVSVKNDEDE